ncbi:MAG: molybdopterin-dependent oxidoreductase [Chloroflexi bacterium]|nr:molybdopterin-dependent oxidoreductase [Chloroflexota bacterium]
MSRRIVPTVCHECYAYCGVLVHVNEDTGRVEEITGNPEHPLSRGFICPKGAHFGEVLDHPDRLLYPLKRVGERGEGKWKRISWGEALDYVSDAIIRVRQKYDRRAFVFFPHHIFRLPLWIMFMRYLGNNNGLSCLDRCDGGAFLSDYAVFGGYLTCSLDWDYENSGCIAFWGANPARSFPVYWQHLLRAKRKGAKFLVVDPNRTEAAEAADLWLRIRPGSDPALALGMLNVIIEEGLFNEEFVRNWCIGFDRVREHVQAFHPETAARITGLDAREVREAAYLFASNGPACFAPMRNGIAHKMNVTQTSLAHSIMLAITGNVDIPGGELFVKSFEGVLYESDLILDRRFRLSPEIEAETWGYKEFPLYFEGCQGAAHSTVVWQAMREGKIGGMFVLGSDPVMTHADSKETIEAIKNLDFLMVAEYFMTPTAEFADIVLPAATWCEKDDIRTRSTDCIAAVQAAVEAPGECRDDNEVAVELAKRLKQRGYPNLMDFPWNSVEDFNAFRMQNCNVSFSEFKQKGLLLFPKRYRSFEKNGFKTPSGKIELCPSRFTKYGYDPLPRHLEPSQSPLSSPDLAKEYPLTLITGSRELEYYHSSHRQLTSVRRVHPHPTLKVHPSTAEEFGVIDGELYWIKTPRGRVKMAAKVTDGVYPGVVLAQHGWWFPEDKSSTAHAFNESNVNLITFKGKDVDPILGSQTFKSLLCTLEKA